MNLNFKSTAARSLTLRRCSGMTLPEVTVTTAIFMVAMAGFLLLQLFSLKMNEIAKAKLGASDDARDSVSRMVAEIRAAGLIRIGTGDGTSFSEIPFGSEQKGNAAQIYPVKGNTNDYIRYYLDSTDTRLKRVSTTNVRPYVVASAITNRLVFTSENFKGQILSNNFNNRVIGVTLQFYQLEFPRVGIGPGCQYDFYQLRTKITRRAIE